MKTPSNLTLNQFDLGKKIDETLTQYKIQGRIAGCDAAQLIADVLRANGVVCVDDLSLEYLVENALRSITKKNGWAVIQAGRNMNTRYNYPHLNWKSDNRPI